MEEALLNPIQADPPSRYAVPLFELHKREAAAEAQVAARVLEDLQVRDRKRRREQDSPAHSRSAALCVPGHC